MNKMKQPSESGNLMPAVAAVAAIILGLFLVLGGIGHLAAVLPVSDVGGDGAGHAVRLPLPGLILCFTGLMNLLMARAIWRTGGLVLNTVIALNMLLLVYLVYLLVDTVPDHPVGIFAFSVAAFITIALVTRSGLRWPAKPV